MVMTSTAYEKVQKVLINEPKTWLITGVVGFIGSNLLEELLLLNQKVALGSRTYPYLRKPNRAFSHGRI